MADPPLWLTEADVANLASLNEVIDILETTYGPRSQDSAQTMPRAHARDGDTILHAVGGMMPEAGVAGTKTWVYSPHGASPLVVVFSSRSGALLGIVEAFNLGLWRTSATSGLGTKFLARGEADVLALIGTGKQALSQACAVAAVRPLREVRVFGRNRESLDAFGRSARASIDAELSLHTDVRTAVTGASIVTTVTRAGDAFLSGDVLEPGMHINAVGAIVPSRRELMVSAVARCDKVVADSPVQAISDSGELGGAVEAGVLSWDQVVGLADVIAAPELGRTSDDQISLFKTMGVGLSDVAIAAELLDRARSGGVGTRLPATPDPHSFKPTLQRSTDHV